MDRTLEVGPGRRLVIDGDMVSELWPESGTIQGLRLSATVDCEVLTQGTRPPSMALLHRSRYSSRRVRSFRWPGGPRARIEVTSATAGTVTATPHAA